jgi:hypothetical protein
LSALESARNVDWQWLVQSSLGTSIAQRVFCFRPSPKPSPSHPYKQFCHIKNHLKPPKQAQQCALVAFLATYPPIKSKKTILKLLYATAQPRQPVDQQLPTPRRLKRLEEQKWSQFACHADLWLMTRKAMR